MRTRLQSPPAMDKAEPDFSEELPVGGGALR
jgi:hypothetical protein